MWKNLVFLLAFFLLFTPYASAETISTSIGFNESYVEELARDVLFDPSLGSLNSVEIDVIPTTMSLFDFDFPEAIFSTSLTVDSTARRQALATS